MLIKQLFDEATWTYTYLLADPAAREAIIIDPVIEQTERDLKLIAELGLELIYVLDTHVHADHITGAGALRRATGALSGVAEVAEVPCVDVNLKHGDTLNFGAYKLEVRATPGHTNGCLTYVVEDGEKVYAFTGDALFIRGCGRTDFQQGDAKTLYQSVHKQIYSLPPETVIYPGHDYRGHTSSTVNEEKEHNPRLRWSVSEESFVALMEGLNLSHPKRIHEALPANMMCGFSPEESVDGVDEQHLELNETQIASFAADVILDVRSPEEFRGEHGHLPDAQCVPLSLLDSYAEQLDTHQKILVVCRSGRRSRQACRRLTEMGFVDVANLSGGMLSLR